MEVKGRMKQLITFAILVLTCVHHFHRGGMGQAHLYVQDYVLPNPNQDTGSSERSPPEECTNQNPNCGDGKSCVLDSRAKRSKFMDKGSMIKGKCLLTPEGMDPTANVNSAGHCTQFIHDCAEDYSCYLVHTVDHYEGVCYSCKKGCRDSGTCCSGYGCAFFWCVKWSNDFT